jgi:hypothetical protein
MPQEMRVNDLFELGGVARLTADMGDTRTRNGLSDARAWKEPGLELIEFPVAPQRGEQVRREHDETIAFPLALVDLDDHPFGVDVRALELTEFGDPEAGGIQRGEDRAMLEVARCQQQRLDLVATEDDGERLGLFGIGNIVTIHGRPRVVS